ncbi:MAG: hypothetical protein ACR2O1_12840 [Boseongicola sp.]
MSKATNLSRGRATRLTMTSRRRGTSFYDRLEEARLRRQVVLANKTVAGSSPHLINSASPQSERADVEISTKGPTDEYSVSGQAEKPDNSMVLVNGDSDGPKLTPRADADDAFGQSWRLFFPGIALGFVLAIFLIGWASSPSDLMTPATEAQSLAAKRPAPRIRTATLKDGLIAGKSPLISHQISNLKDFVPAQDRPAAPKAEGWLLSTNVLAPAQIVPATVELPPLMDVAWPALHTGAPTVLSITPPARPKAADIQVTAGSTIAGLDIVLHVPNGVRQTDAQNLTTAATKAGFEIRKIRPASFSISQTNVRYFYKSNEIAARKLASAIDGRLRDFTEFEPLPDPGVIEIWLEGRGTSASRQEDSAERGGILRELSAELRRILRPIGG